MLDNQNDKKSAKFREVNERMKIYIFKILPYCAKGQTPDIVHTL